MVQLRILSGKRAGSVVDVRRFPFSVGRDRASELSLEETGIWDRHLELRLQLSEGILLKALTNALTNVNGQSIEESILRNGDLIEIGSLKMRFWLNDTQQLGLRLRESMTWVALALLCAGQIVLIYRWLP